MYCPINGCPAGAYIAIYGLCALLIGAIVAMLGIEEGWWKRLRALWNYDPVAMQKAMLREVWARRTSYRPEAKRAAKRALLDRLSVPISTGQSRDLGGIIRLGAVRSVAPVLVGDHDRIYTVADHAIDEFKKRGPFGTRRPWTAEEKARALHHTDPTKDFCT